MVWLLVGRGRPQYEYAPNQGRKRLPEGGSGLGARRLHFVKMFGVAAELAEYCSSPLSRNRRLTDTTRPEEVRDMIWHYVEIDMSCRLSQSTFVSCNQIGRF